MAYLQEYDVQFIGKTSFWDFKAALGVFFYMGRTIYLTSRVLPVAYLQEYNIRILRESPHLGTVRDPFDVLDVDRNLFSNVRF